MRYSHCSIFRAPFIRPVALLCRHVPLIVAGGTYTSQMPSARVKAKLPFH